MTKEEINDQNYFILIQPIFCSSTLMGEALIRGYNKNASDVIEEVRENNLEAELDLFVINKVIEIIKVRKIETPISINLTPKTMNNSLFFDYALNIISYNKIDPNLILFEVNERTEVDSVVKSNIKKIINFGIKVMIDDFGINDNSISQLSKLESDIVKIDKLLVDNIQDNKNSLLILKNMINLIHELDKTIVIEGVETITQKFLIDCITDNVSYQGFLFSEPINVDDFLKLAQIFQFFQDNKIKTKKTLLT